MNNSERYQKIDELVQKFKNGEELYRTSPMFNTTIQMMVKGLTVYEAFEQIILAHERTQRAFEDYVMRDTRPISRT